MPIANSPHAPVSARRPEAWGICDRCGFRWLHRNLRWQYDWRGNQLQNLWLLVCHICEDVPNEQLRPIIIGPDPVPVKDPRPGWAATQMGFTPVFTVTQALGFGAPSAGPAGYIQDDVNNAILDDESNEILGDY